MQICRNRVKIYMPFSSYIYEYIYFCSKGTEIASDLLKIERIFGLRKRSPQLVITCYTPFEMLAALGFLACKYSLFEIASAGSLKSFRSLLKVYLLLSTPLSRIRNFQNMNSMMPLIGFYDQSETLPRYDKTNDSIIMQKASIFQ